MHERTDLTEAEIERKKEIQERRVLTLTLYFFASSIILCN